jgi:hypothetical protein
MSGGLAKCEWLTLLLHIFGMLAERLHRAFLELDMARWSDIQLAILFEVFSKQVDEEWYFSSISMMRAVTLKSTSLSCIRAYR